MTYPNGYNFLQMESPAIITARRAIYWLSINTFGFTPTLTAMDCKIYNGGFVVYINNPIWPSGSSHSTSTYKTALLAALGKGYSVGLGELYISIEFTPS